MLIGFSNGDLRIRRTGGVESRGKYIRLQALTPIPAGDTLAAINAQLLAQLDARRDTRPSSRAI